MINIFFILTLLITIIGCGAQQTVKQNVTNNAIALVKSDTNIYITVAEKKLGTLYAGETVEGSLLFENKTDTLLTINTIKGSCGCMTIKESFDSLKKGEKKSIKYIIDTFGKSDDEYFDIMIITSSGKYIVELTANVKQNIN
ncbi:MAG: DUF1573 domain-containing protein [Rikenellaceae bacterium]